MEQVVFNEDGTYFIIERWNIGQFYLNDQGITDDSEQFLGTYLEQANNDKNITPA